MENIPDLSCGKTSQERSHHSPVRTSGQSLKKSAKSKTMPFLFLDLRSGQNPEKSWQTDFRLHGGRLTHNTGESPREENASILSQILTENVPEKYSLSPKACQGILRRASERGKVLPEILRSALEQQSRT